MWAFFLAIYSSAGDILQLGHGVDQTLNNGTDPCVVCARQFVGQG